MRMYERMHRRAARHPRLADCLLALLLFGLATTICFRSSGQTPGAVSPLALAWQGGIFALLVFRTICPRTVMVLTTLGCAGLMLWLDGYQTPAMLAPAASLAQLAGRGGRRATIGWWAAAGGTMLVAGSVGSGQWFQAEQLGVLVWLGFFAALGEAAQSKRAYVEAIEERALRAEHTREEEARRRVAEERLRIAQELHDVVAHHIAVIHVQAQAAEHLVSRHPEQAAQALGHVRRSSRTVLDELTGLLNVLRRPGESKAPVEPSAGVADLPRLIRDFEVSGLQVSWAVRGSRAVLPPAVDLVAYRLVQEGLTNAHKHGVGQALLDVSFTQDGLVIDLTNKQGAMADPAPALGTDPGPGTDSLLGGYGLIGMRERALAVGGSLRAAPEPGGIWRVRARLPIPVPDQEPVVPVVPDPGGSVSQAMQKPSTEQVQDDSPVPEEAGRPALIRLCRSICPLRSENTAEVWLDPAGRTAGSAEAESRVRVPSRSAQPDRRRSAPAVVPDRAPVREAAR